eukprot:UN33504
MPQNQKSMKESEVSIIGCDKILNQHNSFIVDNVHSFIRSKLTCQCGNLHYNVDSTAFLHVPVPVPNTKLIKVVFHDGSHDPHIPPTLYTLELSKTARILALKRLLAEIRGTSLNMEVCEILHHKPQRRFKNNDLVEDIVRKCGTLVCSHFEPEEGKPYVNILCSNETAVRK